MDWEYPPPQPPHLLEPAPAGKAGISSQKNNKQPPKQQQKQTQTKKTKPKQTPSKKGSKTQSGSDFLADCADPDSKLGLGECGLPLLPHRVNSVPSGVNSIPTG